MNRKNRISSETAARYGTSVYATSEAENQIIADAIAILDTRIKRGDAMSDPSTVGSYFRLKLAPLGRECFAAVFLDTRHRVISYEEIFWGTIDGAEVHPRIVVKRALELNAAALIIAHNHPSGNPEPSAGDRAVTARLKQALALVDVRLLDHFIIGDGTPTSFARMGLI